jgi:hypothetical protein
MPYVTGVLGARYGLRMSFLVVPAALVGIVLLLGLRERRVPSSEFQVPSR